MLAQQLLLPLYWVLHSIATVQAAAELMIRPHFWAKTAHGLTRLERSFAPTLIATEGALDELREALAQVKTITPLPPASPSALLSAMEGRPFDRQRRPGE